MKTNRINLPFLIIILLILLVGCASGGDQLNAEAMALTAQAHLTSVAYLNETARAIAQQTENVLPTLPATRTYAPTLTKRPQTLIPTTPGPSPTITETLTPSPSPSPTPLAVARVTGNTNCRTGPGKSYPWVALITVGTTVDIIARDISGNYFVIQNPYDEGVCWLWNAYTEIIRPSASLPLYAAPPTARPTFTPRNTIAPDFRIYEAGLLDCNGVDSLVIRISNYSREGFSSWRARVFNPGYINQGTYLENQFSHSPEDCELSINFLPYRTSGYAIIPIDLSQGDTFLVEFEACTLDNKLGDCAFDGLYIDKEDLIGTPTPTP